jgi:hypothetical protein
VPQAAQCASVRQWKEEELATPLARAVFGSLGLQHVIGRTGSVRARLIVVGIFLLFLLVPLQVALNQLTLEFRTRQAISRAQAIFDVPNRSTVISSSSTIGDDAVYVRIQVATNQLFTVEDTTRFEERVSDQAGQRARLDLVQTVSDIGKADTIRRLLSGPSQVVAPMQARSVSESLQEMGMAVGQVLAELPLPGGLRILTVRSALVGAGGPALEVAYLANAELGNDAREMLASFLAARTRVDVDRLALRWVPAVRTLRFSRNGTVDPGDEQALRDLGATLAGHPDLVIALEVPPTLSAKAAEAARQEIQRRIGVVDLPMVIAPADTKTGTATLRLTARTGSS